MPSFSAAFSSAFDRVQVQPQPVFEQDRWNLAGVYAILPQLGPRPKFIEIKFTFNDATYDRMFYTDDKVKAEIDSINLMEASRLPFLEIEGINLTSKLTVPRVILENLEKA